eukprot:CAMPEP_0114605606 /NCGR_PEP_ID=MMETSP0168-20121206/1140_1 /TAXON_ID=95228 ORGANISM="Vannella sp., Strain DIVA3 517/6/12" /NCGR_SAMPLE_ID=MMETSP0168 /ASSEMBLY_ACC=CAM_ASM_000044 /LENGTH=79 /DNA_ID=CAMNT_0001816459 /DNA_START=244 /DNA_END=484 /DNA_ORIENTATION=-
MTVGWSAAAEHAPLLFRMVGGPQVHENGMQAAVAREQAASARRPEALPVNAPPLLGRVDGYAQSAGHVVQHLASVVHAV